MELYNEGLTDKEMAEELDWTISTIADWRRENNLPVNKFYKKKHEKRMELYNEGLTDKEITERLDLGSSTIGVWRKRNNLPPNNKEE